MSSAGGSPPPALKRGETVIFEAHHIQQEFKKHFKAKNLKDLVVPDGDYLVPAYDEYFNVRVKNNRFFIQPENFDESKAILIPTNT